MSSQDWQDLRDWLYRVFPAKEAAELLEAHIAEARDEGLPMPTQRDTGTWIKW